ncbi:MAG: DUF2383 domain-containing protein [Desulfuromonadales bacterium]
MSLLRTEAESALDRVSDRCKEAADAYRTARAATHDTDLAKLFVALEESRRRDSAALEGEIRRMGNLPGAPDADRETMEHLAIRVKAVVSTDERRALLASCRQPEERLAAAVEAALEQNLPAATLALLQRLREEGAQVRRRLTTAPA